jgi:hypothetical protein
MGVLTIGRPIMRLGYLKWLTASRLIDSGCNSEDEEPPEYKIEKLEEKRDAFAIQIVGPSLVAFDTLFNGFSSFIP